MAVIREFQVETGSYFTACTIKSLRIAKNQNRGNLSSIGTGMLRWGFPTLWRFAALPGDFRQGPCIKYSLTVVSRTAGRL